MRQRFAFFLLLALAATANAADSVGRVIFAVGDVRALRGGGNVALTSGAAVERGDEIHTGKASSVQIRFTDTGLVALRAETVFAVDQFVFKGDQDGSELAVFKLLKGGLRTVTGLIGRLNQKNYGIVTPTSTIGIRGTHFNLVVCADNCRNADGSAAPSGTYGGVLEGRIVLIPNSNPAGARDFAKGQFFFSPNASNPPQQLPLPPAFVADKLEAQQRADEKAVAGASATGTSTPSTTAGQTADSTSATAAEQTAAQPVAASTPLAAPTTTPATPAQQPALQPVLLGALPAPAGDAATAPIATAVVGTATGFVAQYYSGTAYYSLDSCGGTTGNCQANSATQFTPTGNDLLAYSNLPTPIPQGSLGSGTVVDAGSANIAGANYSWGRWTGAFTVSDANGTYTNLPSGVLFGRTDDPNANGQNKAFPTTGAVNYVLVGGPRPVDTAGNVGTVNSMSGTLDFGSRNISFSATLSMPVPVQGSAGITMSGGGKLVGTNDNLLGAALNVACTGAGCGGGTAGQFDVRFGGSAAQVMVVNGIAFNVLRNSAGSGTNSVLFLNMLKCSSGC